MFEDHPHPAHQTAEPHPTAQPKLLARLIAAITRLTQGLPMRWVITGLGGVLLIGAALAVTHTAGDTRLTAEEPVVRIDEYLSITLEGTQSARVRVKATGIEETFGESAQNRWRAASQALPPYLEPVSPVYEITTTRSADLLLAFNLEEAATYDLYRWDLRSGQWQFVPAQIETGTGILHAKPVGGPFALFRRAALAPLIGTFLSEGQSLDGPHAALINVLFVTGVEAQPDGSLNTDHLETGDLAPGSYTVLPVVRVADQDALGELLKNKSAWKTLVEDITLLLDERGFAGVALDFGELDTTHREAFHTLVEDLGMALHRQENLLALRLPTPVERDSGWDTGAYDWRRLAELADMLIVTPPGSPGEYVPGGMADRFLTWASGEVGGVKLHVAFSSLSVDEWAGQLNPITYEYALVPLGMVDVNPELREVARHPEPGQELTFNLVGVAANIARDEPSGVYYYEVFVGGGPHRVWLTTPATLRERLDRVAAHHIGGVIVEDLLAEGDGDEMLTALQEFKVNRPSTLDPLLSLRWTVRDAGGKVLLETTTNLGAPLSWTPEHEGEYIISANLAGVGHSDRGALALIVGGKTVGVAPAQEAVVDGAPDTTAAQNPILVPIPDDMPPPVVRAGAVGNFELGGQVNHVIRHPDQMRQAGMTWVKFQLAWGEGTEPSVAWDLIDRGRSENFKVLLSITGQSKYPNSINVESFLDFLRGVAYYGADAIEVWNEPNLDFEWPRGRVDGAAYTRELLAPAFNAIKEVNPHTMVISAAPSPTGAFFGDGGCSLQGYGCDDWLFLQQMAEAGAANYMDCVGAHYNSGATSPSWNSGHPADPGYQHYSWYYGSMLQLYAGTFGHPVCFTELGYLSGEGYGTVPDRFNWAAHTTVSQQAAWLAEAAQLSMQSGQVRLVIVWNVDFTYWGDDPMAGYAMIRADGSCPACSALGNVMP